MRLRVLLAVSALACCARPPPSPPPAPPPLAEELRECPRAAPLPAPPKPPRTFESVIHWTQVVEEIAEQRGTALVRCDERRAEAVEVIDKMTGKDQTASAP